MKSNIKNATHRPQCYTKSDLPLPVLNDSLEANAHQTGHAAGAALAARDLLVIKGRILHDYVCTG